MKTMVEAAVLGDAKPVKTDHRKGMVRKESGLIEFWKSGVITYTV